MIVRVFNCQKYLLGLLLIGLSACSSSSKTGHNIEDYYSTPQIDSILFTVARYSTRPPDHVLRADRFQDKYIPYYKQQINRFRFLSYYVDDSGKNYFLLSREHSAKHNLYIGIGGTFIMDSAGHITDYNEAFWTFKMSAEELDKKGLEIFKEMVEKGSVETYLFKNIHQHYVEFPDDNCYYDPQGLEWKTIHNK